MILIIFIISLTGCAEKYNDPNAGTGGDTQTTNDTVDQASQTPSECSTNIDCARLYANNPAINIDACNIPTCTSGKCSVFRKPNCCGNGVAENIEDGKRGSVCTCPIDWGTCNATITYFIDKDQSYDAKYIRRECDKSNNCVVEDVNELQRNNEFFNTFTDSGFTFNIYIKYKTPFDKQNSKFDLEFKLNDADTKTMIQLPVKIIEIRIMDNTNILVRTSTPMIFDQVGKSNNYTLIINDFTVVYPEEIKTVTLSIDYEYTPLVAGSDPVTGAQTYTPGEIIRRKYETDINSIPFIDKTLVK